MVAVPMLKLFSLTVKTLAKPMAKRIKTEAQRHPTFRGVLSRMGQATYNISARISIRNAGHTTTKIKPLEEDKAIADGGDLLAEGFIYGLGTFLMVWEYMSSAKEKEEKEAKAKIKKDQEKREMAQAFEDINNRLAKLEALGQSGVQAKDDKSTPSGGGGGSKVLGLSLAAVPQWGSSRRRTGKAEPTGLKSDELKINEQGSTRDESDWSVGNIAAIGGVSAAEGNSSRDVDSSRGVESVLRGIEGSVDGRRVATGISNSRSASSKA
eukprot:g10878.t1